MVRPAARQLAPAAPRRLLLSIHILTTLGVFGADLSLLVLGLASLSGTAPQAIYPAASLVAANLVAPLAIGSLATGLLLALRSPWGLLRYWWVVVKLAITASLTAVVVLVLVPRLNAAATTATLSGAAPASLALPAGAASVLLAVNAFLGVYKPSWRLPRWFAPAGAASSAARLPQR